MRFPQEVVVEDFLPTYRTLLARRLAKTGLSQDEIAAQIGVSQAQVSKYLGGRMDLVEAIAEDPRVEETVERISRGLAEGRMDTVSALAESLALVRRLENRGPICRLHEERMPELAGTGCDACLDPDSRVMNEHRVLVDLRVAVRRLTTIEGIVEWIPHVGSNLAQAIEQAEGIWDVAALPGRINAVGGQAQVRTEPAFGASRHVATVVLAVGDEHPDLRAALNLAYQDEIVPTIESLDWSALPFDASYEGRRERVRERLAQVEERPDVLYHEGAFGIEPVAYLLGETAMDVVEKAERLIEQVPS